MKTKILICLGILMSFIMLSCGSSKPQLPSPTTKTEKTVTIVPKDTVFVIEADSSFYEAYIDCVNNKPVLKSPKTTASKNKALAVPKVRLIDNKITVDCEVEAQKKFFEWREKFLSEVTITSLPYPVETPLSFWVKFQIWCGRIFLVCVTGMLIWVIVKVF